MKSDITTTILNCVLLVLAVLGIVFAIFYYMRGHELAMIAPQANADRNF
jgi:mannose/fructose/N-acetylgalactosamine-specific phosphotransferase system component IIC